MLPLSFTLDSVGPLAPTVACCAALDAIMAGEEAEDITPFRLDGMRLAAPQTVVLDDMDSTVAGIYAARAVAAQQGRRQNHRHPARPSSAASRASIDVAASRRRKPMRGTTSSSRPRDALYDPRVLVRIMRGKDQDAAHYIELMRARADLIRRVAAISSQYDALVMPTVPIVAPSLASLEAEEQFRSVNLLVLRNTTIANVLDRCAISVPCHRGGDAPVGLMLVGEHGADRRLFAIAAAIEAIVSPGPSIS